jgi:hypothetical protein
VKFSFCSHTAFLQERIYGCIKNPQSGHITDGPESLKKEFLGKKHLCDVYPRVKNVGWLYPWSVLLGVTLLAAVPAISRSWILVIIAADLIDIILLYCNNTITFPETIPEKSARLR